jgi:antitoxin MazE
MARSRTRFQRHWAAKTFVDTLENRPRNPEEAMIKKLTKHGKSWALVIDRPILELLKIDPETPLEISTDGQSLIISPTRDATRRKTFKAALAETNSRYRRTLKRLSE